jgi:transcriptional regulator with XRE-family HTH domain
MSINIKYIHYSTMELKIVRYNSRHDINQEEFFMPKRNKELTKVGKSFGERLANLRHAAGYSQRDFAADVGISQRMVVYYEKECERIPIQLLPLFVKALGVSADQLLGLEKEKSNGKHRDNRLLRRFSQVEKLPAQLRKQIVQILDAFLEREKLLTNK